MNIELTEFVTILGGWSVIFGGLCAWLGKVWAGRILQTENAQHLSKIEKLKSDLELERSQESRISEAQFKLYSDVFSALMDVKSVGDELWQMATEQNIRNFQTVLRNADLEVNRGRLILREVHYRDLLKLLKGFSEYQIGKARLYELNTSQDFNELVSAFPQDEIRMQIKVNRHIKEHYEVVIDDISKEFKSQLGLA